MDDTREGIVIEERYFEEAAKLGACRRGIDEARMHKTWERFARARPGYAIWAVYRIPSLTDDVMAMICEVTGYRVWRNRNGKLHRDDGPAVVHPDGTVKWYCNGKLHRDGGPAIVYPDGTVKWCRNGKLHRDGSPAVVYPDGTEMWYRDGRLHRDDGPAIVYPDDTKEWYRHGKRHRDDGPAIVYSDGTQEWWREGVRIR